MRDRESSGQKFSRPLKAFQMDTLEQLCRGNMSSHSFQEMATYMDRHTQQGLYIGNVVDLVDRYKDVYYDLLVCRHQALLSIEECFPEFGTVSDGTPVKASIEAVRQLRVTHTGHIICVLVYVQLHEKSVDGK